MKPISTKKHKMKFLVRSINLKCQAIDDADGKTVAFVTSQGYVDWLLRSPLEPGERLAEIDKERHLGNVRGLKFNLHLPHCCEQMTGIRVEVAESGDRVIVVGLSVSGDGRLRGECRAELGVDAATGRYVWQLETKLACASAEPVVLPMVEYNNILPARVGGRFLWEQQKPSNAPWWRIATARCGSSRTSTSCITSGISTPCVPPWAAGAASSARSSIPW